MLQAGMHVLETEAKRSLNSFVFSMPFVTSFSAPPSPGLHLQEPLLLSFSLYPYWVMTLFQHFSVSSGNVSIFRLGFLFLLPFPRFLFPLELSQVFLHPHQPSARFAWLSACWEAFVVWSSSHSDQSLLGCWYPYPTLPYQWWYHITDLIVLSKQQLPKNCRIQDCHTTAADTPTVIAISGLKTSPTKPQTAPPQIYPPQPPKGCLKKYFGTALLVLLGFIVHQRVIWWLCFRYKCYYTSCVVWKCE